MTVLALLLTALQQTQAQPDGPRNPLLEGIAVQAGDSLVFLSEFERYLDRARASQPPGTAVDRERQRLQLLRDLTLMRLEEQGGADLGLDPALVERNRRLTMEAEREEKGIAGYVAELERKGTDALAEASDNEQEIYRWLWERKARGLSFGATRETRDPGFRPGELRYFFEETRQQLETVQIRWLIVSSESVGGAEQARESCEDARRRVLAGEDFALLVEERGVELRDSLGLTPFVPARGFQEPSIIPFCETATAGDLSEVIPLTDPRTGKPEPRLGYHLAEMRERRTPDFADPEVQRVLRGALTRSRSDQALGRERERLWRESFVWVNPLVAGPATPPGNRP